MDIALDLLRMHGRGANYVYLLLSLRGLYASSPAHLLFRQGGA